MTIATVRATHDAPTPAPVSPWLNPQGAVEYIGEETVNLKTLEYWRYTGTGPRYTKAGRRVLYRRNWIDEWLEARSVTSTAEAKQLVGV